MRSPDNKIRQLDPDNMFGYIFDFPEQLESAMKVGQYIKLKGDVTEVRNVIIAGMGGSAIAGDVAAAIIGSKCRIPIVVIRNYSLPEWVNASSMVICLSYSGNTEETLSCLHDAFERGATTLGITTGGQLAAELEEQDSDVVIIPDRLPPRAALGYLVVPLLSILKKYGVLNLGNEKTLTSTIDLLKTERNILSQGNSDGHAWVLANAIHTSVPVIYGEARTTAAVALRWRGQLEENAKMVAFHNVLPEMNHNEIVGYHNNPNLLDQLGIIWLSDSSDHERNQKRRELTKSIIGNKCLYQIEVKGKGNSYMERLFYLIHLGDWVSYWCAILHKTNPTPVDNIVQLKKLLLE
ncbi:MAG: bifunctional phosphoglucose/phosphomannose isomerase [Fidelibacterota bacterium]